MTTPAFVTEATDGLLLTHVPPVAGDKVVVAFTQIAELPVILTTGNAFTVTDEVVLLHPVDVWVNVNVALPAARPVTTPAFVTDAIEGLLLTQVPPGVGDNVIVLPTHTDAPAVTTGFAFTVTAEVVALQPVDVWVKVNVALPAARPVTTPAFVTDAIEGLLLTHVPPVVGDRVIVLPTHTEDEGVLTVGAVYTNSI